MQLNGLLDLEQPWTWVLHDPSGQSSFQHMERVVVEVETPLMPLEAAQHMEEND